MIVFRRPVACTGCLRCELACSFHHIRRFSRSSSSIQVIKSIFEPYKDPEITICQTQHAARPICDQCAGEEGSPLCLQFCPEGVFKRGEI
jgi:Fe-S-cluster-containing hydrogenase component 2